MDAIMLRNMFCTECSLQFNKKIVFDLHLSLVHGKKMNIKQEPNNCELPLEGTETINENHNADKPFACKICDYEFAFQDDLNEHTASVHEGRKPFRCDMCDAKFTQKFALNIHIAKVHEGKKPFKCTTCDAKFSQKTSFEHTYCGSSWGKKAIQM